MAALNYDLFVEQGADYKRSIPALADSDGQPTSVVGWAVTGQIRDGYEPAATLLHTLDVTVSGTNVVLWIPGSVSAAWAWRLARYDIKLTAPDNTVTRFIEGFVVVRAQVTP